MDSRPPQPFPAFRPPPAGFRGPGQTMPPGSQPPFLPPGGSAPFPARPPVPFATGANSQPVVAPSANGPASARPPIVSPHLSLPARATIDPENKLSILFVSGISDGVPDEWVEKFLATFGPVQTWRRVTDSTGKPKPFGFAIFEDPESVVRALEIIKAVNPLELPSFNNGAARSVRIQTDNGARFPLEDIKKKMSDNEVFSQSIDEAKKSLDSVLEAMKSALADNFLQSTMKNITETDDHDNGEDLPADMSPTQREIISREIAFFRERSAAKDKMKKKREEMEVEQRRRDERERERQIEKSMTQDEFKVDRQVLKRLKEYDEDEEEEKRRVEKREAEMLQAFQDRERRLEAREQARIRKYESDLLKEADDEKERARRREHMLKLYAEWDDDAENEKGDELFYRDRQRWWSHRQPIRQKELDNDTRDRQDEQEEAARIAAGGVTDQAGSQDLEAMLDSHQNQDKAEASETPVAVNPPAAPTGVVGRIMTVDERKRAITDLIESIPSDRESIWGYTVRWSHLDDTTVNAKLKPFVSKKILEYLGQEEQDLINFILQALRDQKSAGQLFADIEMALDDAETFVKKLWRMVIYETESKALGLQ